MKSFAVVPLMLVAFMNSSAQQKTMMIRIAEIEVQEQYIKEYKEILQEESRASVQLEPGVICIFPMFEKEHSTRFRLLEIYANRECYESHIKSPHFLNYKSSTLKMVKSLKLVEMDTIDPETMRQIFSKLTD